MIDGCDLPDAFLRTERERATSLLLVCSLGATKTESFVSLEFDVESFVRSEDEERTLRCCDARAEYVRS